MRCSVVSAGFSGDNDESADIANDLHSRASGPGFSGADPFDETHLKHDQGPAKISMPETFDQTAKLLYQSRP